MIKNNNLFSYKENQKANGRRKTIRTDQLDRARHTPDAAGPAALTLANYGVPVSIGNARPANICAPATVVDGHGRPGTNDISRLSTTKPTACWLTATVYGDAALPGHPETRKGLPEE